MVSTIAAITHILFRIFDLTSPATLWCGANKIYSHLWGKCEDGNKVKTLQGSRALVYYYYCGGQIVNILAVVLVLGTRCTLQCGYTYNERLLEIPKFDIECVSDLMFNMQVASMLTLRYMPFNKNADLLAKIAKAQIFADERIPIPIPETTYLSCFACDTYWSQCSCCLNIHPFL